MSIQNNIITQVRTHQLAKVSKDEGARIIAKLKTEQTDAAIIAKLEEINNNK